MVDEFSGGVEEGVDDDIEVGDGAEDGTPEDGAVAEFFAEDGFADSGAEGGLGE